MSDKSYSNEAKAYRLWERGTRRVIVRRDVRFTEEQNKVVYPLEKKECEIIQIEKPEEDIEENHEEDVENRQEEREEEEQREFIGHPETPVSKRAPGRPRLERTG
ncbi:hypothetical protein KM043_018793 [Ampulex compressa]|nr:hypothetical protein KM043_018793 [Ampulex compressa]